MATNSYIYGSCLYIKQSICIKFKFKLVIRSVSQRSAFSIIPECIDMGVELSRRRRLLGFGVGTWLGSHDSRTKVEG